MPEKKKTVVAVVKKQTAIAPATSENSADLLISQAVDKGLPVETMERLVALREKIEAGNAKKAFDEAMSDFQSKCPIIQKTKSVKTKSGQVAYSYAPIDSIVSQVRPVLAEFGFSYSIQTETLEGKVKATCTAKHRLGHIETSTMEVPLGNKTEIMSQTQVVAAALTFAKRYAFCNVFGIMTGDDDNEKVLQEEPAQAKKDSTNYIDKLKMALYKMGGKTLPEALSVFNKITGSSIKAMPTTQEQAREMYDLLESDAIRNIANEN